MVPFLTASCTTASVTRSSRTASVSSSENREAASSSSSLAALASSRSREGISPCTTSSPKGPPEGIGLHGDEVHDSQEFSLQADRDLHEHGIQGQLFPELPEDPEGISPPSDRTYL